MKNRKWIIIVFIWTFILSILFSYITNIIADNSHIIVMVIITLCIIAIGIIFDMIGAAALTASEKTFHAMSSQKIKGSKTAIIIIKNSAKVASICNDIIGDICGVIAGGLGVVLAISINDNTFVNIIITALISALTVGGKAIFKNIAIKKADKIIYTISKILSPIIK